MPSYKFNKIIDIAPNTNTVADRLVSFSLSIKQLNTIESKITPMFCIGKNNKLSNLLARITFNKLHAPKHIPVKLRLSNKETLDNDGSNVENF